MRVQSFFIFLAIFLTIYGCGNYYVYVRFLQSIPRESSFRIIYTICFITLSASYIIGRFLERITVCRISDVLIWIGSFWLAIFLYLFMSFLVADILFVISKITGFLYETLRVNAMRVRQLVAFISVIIAVFVVATGYWIAHNPEITSIDLTIPHKKNISKTITAVLISDIHLGIIINNSRLEKMVTTIRNLQPDVVFLVGDIVDEDIKPVIEKNLGELLGTITPPLGIFAVTGNHEYIGGVENAVKYLQNHGIIFLRDHAQLIDNVFYLIGREDKTALRFGGMPRKSLQELVKNLHPDYPVIVLDHQPNYVNKNIPQQVVAIFSGHTHNGQLWPINHIVSAIYEVPYGYRQINGVHVYVSRGYGTWGPPVRTVNKPEIVKLCLKFIPQTFALNNEKK